MLYVATAALSGRGGAISAAGACDR